MSNTLFKWFLYWLGAMIILMLLYGFFGPKGREIALDDIDFSTSQSSELYFKNMRSYFYDLEEHSDSKYKIYRIESRLEDAQLNFMILHNWMMGEAYIMAESSSIDLENKELHLLLEEDTLSLIEKDAESQFVFAANLYSHISEGGSVSLLLENGNEAFSEAEIKSLKRNLKDYFKLVGKLR